MQKTKSRPISKPQPKAKRVKTSYTEKFKKMTREQKLLQSIKDINRAHVTGFKMQSNIREIEQEIEKEIKMSREFVHPLKAVAVQKKVYIDTQKEVAVYKSKIRNYTVKCYDYNHNLNRILEFGNRLDKLNVSARDGVVEAEDVYDDILVKDLKDAICYNENDNYDSGGIDQHGAMLISVVDTSRTAIYKLISKCCEQKNNSIIIRKDIEMSLQHCSTALFYNIQLKYKYTQNLIILKELVEEDDSEIENADAPSFVEVIEEWEGIIDMYKTFETKLRTELLNGYVELDRHAVIFAKEMMEVWKGIE